MKPYSTNNEARTNPSKKLKWTETIIPNVPTQKCKHYFKFINGECKCINCGMGLMGVIEVKDGRPIV